MRSCLARYGGPPGAVVASGWLALALWSPQPSWAYWPFASTDAAVADPKQVEIEVGDFTLERNGDENSFIIPRVVFNYGFLKNWEAVAGARFDAIPKAGRAVTEFADFESTAIVAT